MRKRISRAFSNQKGQTMLIVVLAIVIALTVGLSVVSRSITTLKTSTEEANSQKALSAAEIGIERALKGFNIADEEITGSLDNGVNFLATVSAVLGSNIRLNGGNMVNKDEGIDLWLVDHNTDGTPDYSASWTGTISVYWGQSDDVCSSSEATNTMAALEIVVISGTLSSPTLKRYTVDPCSARAAQNQFNSIDGNPNEGDTVLGKEFPYSRRDISISSGLVAKIIPVYASTQIAVVANSDLPSQGLIVNSTGRSGAYSGLGTTERKVSVFQGYSSLPTEYFPNNFFFNNSL